MPLKDHQLKHGIIKGIVTVAANIDDLLNAPPPKKEIYALALEIASLVAILSKPPLDLDLYNDGKLIRPRSDNYLYVKRVLEMMLFQGVEDFNLVARELEVSLTEANRLMQAGIDYLIDNISFHNYARRAQAADAEYYSSLASNSQLPAKLRKAPPTLDEAVYMHQAADLDANQAAYQQAINNAGTQEANSTKKKSIGCFAPILFLVLLFAVSFYLYQRFMNHHATEVTSLVQEYRDTDAANPLSVAKRATKLEIGGSSTLIRAFETFQKEYQIDHKKLKIKLVKNDSSQAINDLIEGKINLAATSRAPTTEENKAAIQATGKSLTEYRVALDAVAIVVHPSNPISKISITNLKKIYESDIASWRKLTRFPDSDKHFIIKFSKTFHHGTVGYFKQKVMHGVEFDENVMQIYDVDQMLSMIEHNEDAIGFASLSDVINRRVKILPVASVFEGKAVSPLKGRKTANAEAIKKGFYPLTRYMYFVHLGEKPNLAQAEFIDYMRSGPVQVKLAKLGLVSLY